MIKSGAKLFKINTGKLIFVSDDVWMIKFFHYVNFLIYIFLEKRLLFDMHFADDFDSIKLIGCFWIGAMCTITGKHHLPEGSFTYRFDNLIIFLLECFTHVLELFLIWCVSFHTVFSRNLILINYIQSWILQRIRLNPKTQIDKNKVNNFRQYFSIYFDPI